MSDPRLEDLRRFERAYDDDHDRYFLRYPTVTASEVASVLSDADLLGELVRRGVLRTEQAPVWIDAWHIKEGEWISRFVSNWSEPVGSVGETP